MAKITKIHHVALVVPDAEASLSFWRDTLGIPLAGKSENTAQESVIAFLPVGEAEVELVQPTNDTSGIAKYLAKRGPGMHHVCLEVDDLDGMLSKLKENNVRLIGEKPTQTDDGRRMMFIHPESAGGVLVELYEKK